MLIHRYVDVDVRNWWRTYRGGETHGKHRTAVTSLSWIVQFSLILGTWNASHSWGIFGAIEIRHRGLLPLAFPDRRVETDLYDVGIQSESGCPYILGKMTSKATIQSLFQQSIKEPVGSHVGGKWDAAFRNWKCLLRDLGTIIKLSEAITYNEHCDNSNVVLVK